MLRSKSTLWCLPRLHSHRCSLLLLDLPCRAYRPSVNFPPGRVYNCLLNRWLRASSIPSGLQPAKLFGEKKDEDCGSSKQWPYSGFGMLLSAVALCGSDRDQKRDNWQLIIEASKGNVSKMEQLLDSGADVNYRHQLGWTALHAAIINGNLEAVKLLVSRGADVDMRDEFSTAKRVAYKQGVSAERVAMIRDREFCSFVNHHANYSGFTALHYAVLTNDRGIIEELLESGADPIIENHRGLLPSDYCTNPEILSLLEEYTNKSEEIKAMRKLEERRQFPLEDRVKEAMIGQEGPITAAAAAIRRRELGWGDNEHPLVFLFLGSSGIGKTELAKQIAKYIHKEKKEGFIRLDMTEYQEKHEVAKLIGAPPGYVGYDQGGQLTSRLRECPDAVVLFDEVDKAHPDVLTVLLQLFDEGRLTDGQGKTISCKDAIFVMTSNLASDEIATHALRLRKEAKTVSETYKQSQSELEESVDISREFKEQVVEPILKLHFKRDEFLGRITEMLYFLPFSRSELNQLVERELLTWQTRALERHQIKLSWDKEVLDVLADGYNVKYGARSIQHEVEKSVVNKLAAASEQGVITKGSHVSLVADSANGPSAIRLQVHSTQNK